MNGDSAIQFSFTGQLSVTAQDSISDSNLLGNLREMRSSIERELQRYLPEEIRDDFGILAHCQVQIRFDEGSVLFSGIITLLGAMATVAGAVDFVEKMRRLIRRVLRWVLARRAPGRYVRVQVVPAFSTAATGVAPPSNSRGEQLFDLRTILLAVTLLNAVLFVGGTVYTGLSVASIQEKYDKAKTEIERVRQDYEKYRAGLQERLGDVEGQLRTTAKETDETRNHAKQLSEDLKSIDAQVQDLNASVAGFRNRGSSWVSLRLAWRQANWVLKSYLIAVPVSFLMLLLANSILVFLWIKNR